MDIIKNKFRTRNAVIFGVLFGLVMAVTAGAAVTAIWPRTAFWMEWAICAKESKLTLKSRSYSYRPGQRGVEHKYRCVPTEAKDPAAANGKVVTFETFAWMTLFWMLPMILLSVLFMTWAFGKARRRFHMATSNLANFNQSVQSGGDPNVAVAQLLNSMGVDLNSANVKVVNQSSNAPQQVVVKSTPVGVGGTEVDAKLSRLEKIDNLKKQGVIDDQQYEALKKEILG